MAINTVLTEGRDTTAGFDAQDAIRAVVLADGYLSQTLTNRMYSEYAPQGTALPYIVTERVAAEHTNHLSGSGGLVMPDIQVDIYAKTKTSRDDIRKNVRDVLDGYTGTVTIGEETLYIQRCQLSRDNTDLVQPDDGSDRQIWRGSLDFEVAHVETIPTF